MRHLLLAVIFFLCLMLQACMTTSIPMTYPVLNQIEQAPEVTAIHYRSPNINVETFTSIAFLAGGPIFGVMASQGISQHDSDQLVDGKTLVDPVVLFKDKFLKSKESENIFKNLSFQNIPFESPKIKDLKSQFSEGLILDFQTTGWMIDLLYMKHYYIVQARLIDISTERIIWQETVDSVIGKTNKTEVAFREVKDENIDGLIKFIQWATDECVEKLILKLSSKS